MSGTTAGETAPPDAQQVCLDTRSWLERLVVGLNLCPFAAPVIARDQLRLAVCAAPDRDAQLRALLQELDLLQRSDEETIATTLLIFSGGPDDFDDYLDLLAMAEDLLEQAQLDGIIQIASFHPRYVFADSSDDDPANCSNRSPWPMLHLLREAQLTRVLASFPHPEQIPLDNIARLRALGAAGIAALLRG